MLSPLLSLLLLLSFDNCAGQQRASDLLPGRLREFDWLIGRWETEYIYGDGLVFWPTIPTMNYEETLEYWPAEESSQSGGVYYINYTAIATSLNSGDHFHNEYGYLTISPSGYVRMFAIGNNGFATDESGTIGNGYLRLESDHIDKIIVARELEVEAIVRTFSLEGQYLHQRVFMRTITHPTHRQGECDNRHDEPRCMQAHAHQSYKKTVTLEQKLQQLEDQKNGGSEKSPDSQPSKTGTQFGNSPSPSSSRTSSVRSSPVRSSPVRSSPVRSSSSFASSESSPSISGVVNGPAFRNKWKGWQEKQG